ncbi:MAG: 50S ribosomal protein L9 [Candidatus Omnitrophica bacterium]|nr:50S ribosomal protein L9 [Candidatus Omnitrophota bacterium]
MELILLKDVDKVGLKGDIVRVSDGFARNYLLPRALALRSTRANAKFVEEHKERLLKKRAKEKSWAQTKAEELKNLKLILEANAGESDKLYGSVTSEDIRQALLEKGYKIDKKHIRLEEPIRTLGSHVVTVELYPQVKVSVTVEVIRKS